MKEENFEHFGIEFNSNEIKKYLNRENFAIINTACENNECIRYRREHWDYFEKIRDNINIDDYITLRKNGKENQYKVVGFIQSVNYSGEVIEITLDGYKKLDDEYIPKLCTCI